MTEFGLELEGDEFAVDAGLSEDKVVPFRAGASAGTADAAGAGGGRRATGGGGGGGADSINFRLVCEYMQ